MTSPEPEGSDEINDTIEASVAAKTPQKNQPGPRTPAKGKRNQESNARRVNLDYFCLVGIALRNYNDSVPTGKLYEFVETRFPHCICENKVHWQNALRHAVSQKTYFFHGEDMEKGDSRIIWRGKGKLWKFKPEAEAAFIAKLKNSMEKLKRAGEFDFLYANTVDFDKVIQGKLGLETEGGGVEDGDQDGRNEEENVRTPAKKRSATPRAKGQPKSGGEPKTPSKSSIPSAPVNFRTPRRKSTLAEKEPETPSTSTNFPTPQHPVLPTKEVFTSRIAQTRNNLRQGLTPLKPILKKAPASDAEHSDSRIRPPILPTWSPKTPKTPASSSRLPENFGESSGLKRSGRVSRKPIRFEEEYMNKAALQQVLKTPAKQINKEVKNEEVDEEDHIEEQALDQEPESSGVLPRIQRNNYIHRDKSAESESIQYQEEIIIFDEYNWREVARVPPRDIQINENRYCGRKYSQEEVATGICKVYVGGNEEVIEKKRRTKRVFTIKKRTKKSSKFVPFGKRGAPRGNYGKNPITIGEFIKQFNISVEPAADMDPQMAAEPPTSPQEIDPPPAKKMKMTSKKAVVQDESDSEDDEEDGDNVEAEIGNQPEMEVEPPVNEEEEVADEAEMDDDKENEEEDGPDEAEIEVEEENEREEDDSEEQSEDEEEVSLDTPVSEDKALAKLPEQVVHPAMAGPPSQPTQPVLAGPPSRPTQPIHQADGNQMASSRTLIFAQQAASRTTQEDGPPVQVPPQQQQIHLHPGVSCASDPYMRVQQSYAQLPVPVEAPSQRRVPWRRETSSLLAIHSNRAIINQLTSSSANQIHQSPAANSQDHLQPINNQLTPSSSNWAHQSPAATSQPRQEALANSEPRNPWKPQRPGPSNQKLTGRRNLPAKNPVFEGASSSNSQIFSQSPAATSHPHQEALANSEPRTHWKPQRPGPSNQQLTGPRNLPAKRPVFDGPSSSNSQIFSQPLQEAVYAPPMMPVTPKRRKYSLPKELLHPMTVKHEEQVDTAALVRNIMEEIERTFDDFKDSDLNAQKAWVTLMGPHRDEIKAARILSTMDETRSKLITLDHSLEGMPRMTDFKDHVEVETID